MQINSEQLRVKRLYSRMLFLPQKLYFQAMRYEKYIMGVVLLLVFFGLLNTPLNLCVNAAWRLLLNLTGFVELLFGIA